MSMRYIANILKDNYDPLRVPSPPTIGTASTSATESITVAFTAAKAPREAPVTSYVAVAIGTNKFATGTSSPLTITGLTNGTAYTCQVYAINMYGASYPSAASNSVTPLLPQQVAYTVPGTYSFVAPPALNPATVSVVCVGAGGSVAGYYGGMGGGGGLGYKNNYPVTLGASYTVVVGTPGKSGTAGGDSYFVNTSVVKGGGGGAGTASFPSAGTGGSGGGYTGDGGGNGGNGGGSSGSSGQPYPTGGGGGAGGYSGNGGPGAYGSTSSSSSGTPGSGGGGGGGASGYDNVPNQGDSGGGGGGGVGLLGQGPSGAGGTGGYNPTGPQTNGGPAAGKGGSGGTPGAGTSISQSGGNYGGGGGVYNPSIDPPNYWAGGFGAVRIIYSDSGVTRAFPSTNTGDL